MSKRIPEPNFLQVPNVVIDELMPEMSDAAFKLYMLILRKTRGWWKDQDSISLTQFETLSKKSRPTVIKCINELIELGLIVELPPTIYGNTYAINTAFDISGIKLKFPSKKFLLVKNFYYPSKKILLPLVKNFYPQNTLSKNTKSKDTNLRAEQFEIFWKAYPNKKDKKRAEQKFHKIDFKKNPFEKIIAFLEKQKQSFDWQKENGRYVPMASTWIHGERWNDEIRADSLINDRNVNQHWQPLPDEAYQPVTDQLDYRNFE